MDLLCAGSEPHSVAGAAGRICLQEPLRELCESPQSGTVWGSRPATGPVGQGCLAAHHRGGRRRVCGLWEGGRCWEGEVAGNEAAGKEVVKACVSCDTTVSGLRPLENRHCLPN